MLSAVRQWTIDAFNLDKYLFSERTFILIPFQSVFWKSCERSGVDSLPGGLQAELNQGGGWERLCMERDPFILTGLMWSWLEQLKEPVISVQHTKDLNPLTGDTPALANLLGRVSASFETGNMRWNYQRMWMMNDSSPRSSLFPGSYRNINMHTGLHGSHADDTGGGWNCIPESHYQGVHLGENRRRAKSIVSSAGCVFL